MSISNTVYFDEEELKRLSSSAWDELDVETYPRRVVSNFSINTDGIRGLLVVERYHMNMPSTSALARLKMSYARKGGVSLTKMLPDVATSLGIFVRRVFVLRTHGPRTVIAAAAENQDEGRDVVMQFVIPGVDSMDDELENLSLLAISKILTMS